MENIKQFNPTKVAIEVKDLTVSYGTKEVLHATNLQFPKHKITALIGASGSGKTTLLRSLNQMHEGDAVIKGQIIYQNLDINSKKVDLYQIRRHIGMVFQRPNPFAKSIYENIAFPLREHGMKNQHKIQEIVTDSLKQAALYDEVQAELNKSALALSGGQQQRLCIARTLAMNSDILLMDEPASALDPISTIKLEETLQTLKEKYTIIIVTHNMEQASRLSDYTAFLHQGRVIEYQKTIDIFTNPQVALTEDYVSGNFG